MKEAFRRLEEEKQEIENKISVLHEIEKEINNDDFILTEDTLKIMCKTSLRPTNKNDLVVKLLEKRFPFMTLSEKENTPIYNEVTFLCGGYKVEIPVSAYREIRIFLPHITPRKLIKKYSDDLIWKSKEIDTLLNAKTFSDRVKAIHTDGKINLKTIIFYLTRYNKKKYYNKMNKLRADYDKIMNDCAKDYKIDLIKRSIQIRKNNAFLKKYAPLFFEFTDRININDGEKIIKKENFNI